MTTEKSDRNDPRNSGNTHEQCCQHYDGVQAPEQQTADAIKSAQVHHEAGRLAQAEAIYRQILQAQPNHADALQLLGLVAHQVGNNQAAVELIGKAVEIQPSAQMCFNLAVAHQALGNADAAADSYRMALALKPDFADSHCNLGYLLQERGELDAAVIHCRKALDIRPDSVPAHINLGNALRDQGKLEAAVESYRRALVLKPDFAEAHSHLAYALKAQGRLDAAVEHYRKALALKPDFAEVHYNMGNALKEQGEFEAAVESYQNALAFKPDFADARSNLAMTLQVQGRLDEAIVCYQHVLQIKPGFTEAHSNLIFTLDLSAKLGTAALQAERKRWDAVHAAPLVAQCRAHANQPAPERRLRIGYVSADFWNHSAASVFGAMLVTFDRSRFDVFAYSNTTIEDALTRRFQHSVTGWRNIVGLSDDAVADLVQQDEIDILVDLSGHSAGNRLLVFARKPAPVQVTAWGYASGTGMRAMDVFFSDPVMVPSEEKRWFAEEVRYLPNALGYFASQHFPKVNALPARSVRFITFGSFNRLAKISDQAFNVWAQVLLAIPDSRLLLKTSELDDAGARDRVRGQFIRAGVEPGRIMLLGKTSWLDQMAAFNHVDIALDPFPHGGGVTTHEGLMMGVPLITLRWPTIAGRVGASILTTLGLHDWIAETPAQYVDIALQKVQDLGALRTLRANLRGMLTTSIICDGAAYTAAVEDEYRLLWRRWCDRQQSSIK